MDSYQPLRRAVDSLPTSSISNKCTTKSPRRKCSTYSQLTPICGTTSCSTNKRKLSPLISQDSTSESNYTPTWDAAAALTKRRVFIQNTPFIYNDEKRHDDLDGYHEDSSFVQPAGGLYQSERSRKISRLPAYMEVLREAERKGVLSTDKTSKGLHSVVRSVCHKLANSTRAKRAIELISTYFLICIMFFRRIVLNSLAILNRYSFSSKHKVGKKKTENGHSHSHSHSHLHSHHETSLESLDKTISLLPVSSEAIVSQSRRICVDFIRNKLKSVGLYHMCHRKSVSCFTSPEASCQSSIKTSCHQTSSKTSSSKMKDGQEAAIAYITDEFIEIGAELQSMYPDLYRDISRQLNVSLSSEEIVRRVYLLFAQDLCQSHDCSPDVTGSQKSAAKRKISHHIDATGLNDVTESMTWGKFAALLCMAGGLAVDCCHQDQGEFVGQIVEAFTWFVGRQLTLWIERQGGWKLPPRKNSKTGPNDHVAFWMTVTILLTVIFLITLLCVFVL